MPSSDPTRSFAPNPQSPNARPQNSHPGAGNLHPDTSGAPGAGNRGEHDNRAGEDPRNQAGRHHAEPSREGTAHTPARAGQSEQVDSSHAGGFTFAQVANHLNVAPATLRRLTNRFDRHLGDGIYATEPSFSGADVAALVTVQQLLSQGYDDEQIHRHLTPAPHDDSHNPGQNPGHAADHNAAALSTLGANALSNAPAAGEPGQPGLPKAINDVLDTLVSGQKAVLNSQSSVREMLGVVAQDNFNLKEENRKLRERMLELERAQGELVRRDEARRERMENRIRALEATVGALQQQVAQIVQAFRRPPKRRGWFG